MKHYDSFENINNDKLLIGEVIWAFNKLDGQNFCVKYNARKKEFCGFGSRTQSIDETHELLGPAVQYFKENNIADKLYSIIKEHSGKRDIFNGIEELTFFFEWYGDNSFAGFHKEGDTMHLALIDVFLKKKGYIDPESFYKLFCLNENIETPKLIYKGKLNQDFIDHIYNYPVEEHLLNPGIFEKEPCDKLKEGVVCRRSTYMKGQRMPKVKIKTKWWLDQVHAKFDQEMWKDLE